MPTICLKRKKPRIPNDDSSELRFSLHCYLNDLEFKFKLMLAGIECNGMEWQRTECVFCTFDYFFPMKLDGLL